MGAQTNEMNRIVPHVPVRGVVRALFGVAIALGLNACQTTTPTSTAPSSQVAAPVSETRAEQAPADDFAYHAAEVTVLEGLRGISQRYITPVKIDELALSGLRGLTTIDPELSLELSADGETILVRHNVDQLASLPVPQSQDSRGWAHLTTDVIRFCRNRSDDLKNADNERVYEALFDGMLAELDVFSRYAGAKEARANRARRDGFGGIGIRFTRAGDSVLITHVMNESPAMHAGLKPGDEIVAVNDKPADSRNLRDVAEMLRGPVGSLLTVTVTRLNAQPAQPDRKIDFNLTRAHIVPETVRVHVDDGMLVLRISSFNKNTSSTIHDVLRAHDAELRDGRIHAIVMDLRGNPGGLLSQSVNVADLFLSTGRIIATRGRHPDSLHDYTAGGIDHARGVPMAVLVDGESASAAEIVASALQDSGRAVVIGSTSYGKGTVQTVLRLPNDGEMTLTWSRFVSPSGYAIHGLGVMPAVCASNTRAQTELDTESLTQAILAPERIEAGRDTMDAWRAAGTIFDGRRAGLRQACPAQVFKAEEEGDLLMTLARRVLGDGPTYRRAVELSKPLNTASRHP